MFQCAVIYCTVPTVRSRFDSVKCTKGTSTQIQLVEKIKHNYFYYRCDYFHLFLFQGARTMNLINMCKHTHKLV